MTPSRSLPIAEDSGRRPVAAQGHAASCFFRSAVPGSGRKALIQITERCNLHCAHCFVSSTQVGLDLAAADFTELVLPRLRDARVERITLTGGEPFAHPDLISLCEAAVRLGLPVGICTNGTGISDASITALRELGQVHVNVSFDGFRAESHGRFRGSPASFAETVDAARRLSAAGLLQGILSTPNSFTSPDEYTALSQFAVDQSASYLLMNPLSRFGRGVLSKGRLAADSAKLVEVRRVVEIAAGADLEVVPIRFPNSTAPLSPCIAGDIIYVFVDGAVAVCPYLVFAARTPESQHSDTEFIVGNILESSIAKPLDAYRFHDRYTVGANATCQSCEMASDCGKGCPASVVAAGGRIGERDVETCPLQ